jgi:CRP/FNR family transcriptional regulator, cyclic AMP receptor protein
MISEIERLLAASPVFGTLPPDEIHRLAVTSQKKTIPSEQKVYAEGERAHVTWVVKDGKMKISKWSFEGKPMTVEMILPGGIFGCVGCLDNGFYPCEATAAAPSTVVGIPTQDFLALLEKYPKFAKSVYLEMSQRMREAQDLRVLAMESVEKRIAGVLLWLWGKFGNVLPFTRQSVAEMANTTPESAVRTLIEFRKRGWIKTAWKKITLVKPTDLKALLENE